MKLTYFRNTPPNFGDEINATMWSHLLPEGFLDDDERELLLGIGSILWDHLPKAPLKHVLGSGFGGYSPPPDMRDNSWNVVWVRGPITAQRLGLDPRLAICDSAILLRQTLLPDRAAGIDVAFMPHFESAQRGNWKEACALAGITYLDPRKEARNLLAEIRGARLLITEAMHGAIVADALRTPWIGIVPFFPQHRMKWQDWAASLGITLRPTGLPPSNLLEAYTVLTGLPGKGRKSNLLLRSGLVAPANSAFTHRAARRLRRLAETVEPQLSSDAAIGRATERCMDALHHFVTAQATGKRRRIPAFSASPPLRTAVPRDDGRQEPKKTTRASAGEARGRT